MECSVGSSLLYLRAAMTPSPSNSFTPPVSFEPCPCICIVIKEKLAIVGVRFRDVAAFCDMQNIAISSIWRSAAIVVVDVTSRLSVKHQ